jgi:hypothetical protein
MNPQKHWMLILSVVIFLVAGLCALGQTVTSIQKTIKAEAQSGEGGAVITVTTTGEPQSHVSTYTFVATEMGFESKVVKGLPFSADTVIDFTQVLGNGQRLYRNNTGALYRDSEGRTRREQTISAINSYAASGAATKSIFINDPVTGVSYIVNPVEQTATKTSSQTVSGSTGSGTASWVVSHGDSGQVHVSSAAGSVQGGTIPHTIIGGAGGSGASTIVHANNSRTEPLGTQMFEGVSAEGTRTIETIPAGTIGNETAIEIVSERWYSDDLGVVVKTVRNDPLSGNNVYQLKNIRRGEPAAELFQVPAGYAVKESVVKFQTIKK